MRWQGEIDAHQFDYHTIGKGGVGSTLQGG